MFDWAKFCLTKGAVKLHLLLDHDGYLPYLAVISEGKKHEVRVARQMQFAPGAILVFDRGYTDYEWFTNLTQQAIYFVTRLKENADCVRQSMLLIRLSLSCVCTVVLRGFRALLFPSCSQVAAVVAETRPP